MSKNNIYYTPERNIISILDEDPRKAAKALIRTHVMHYISILQNIFIYYHNNDENKKHPRTHIRMWANYMRRSKQNFLWTVTFYKTLQEIFKNSISKRNEYYIDTKLDFNDSYLELDKSLPNGRHEICLFDKHINKYLNDKIKYKKLKETFINTNRISYLQCNYPKDMFVNSKVPSWYSKINKTYEFENIIDNMGIRIIRDNLGNYKYYCKPGLSDIWIEIKNVPQDMRFIINGMISMKDKLI